MQPLTSQRENKLLLIVFLKQIIFLLCLCVNGHSSLVLTLFWPIGEAFFQLFGWGFALFPFVNFIHQWILFPIKKCPQVSHPFPLHLLTKCGQPNYGHISVQRIHIHHTPISNMLFKASQIFYQPSWNHSLVMDTSFFQLILFLLNLQFTFLSLTRFPASPPFNKCCYSPPPTLHYPFSSWGLQE